jgi:dihydrofolate reductase
MKITLVIATSMNGKITRQNEPDVSVWTSKEDAVVFKNLIQKHPVLIMGRGTYEAYKNKIELEPGRLRIVMTHNPEKYKHLSVPNQLEFTKEQPKELVKRLSFNGYKKLLLVSGEEINRLFFITNLIDEIQLTLEPWFFGDGKEISLPFEKSLSLKLTSVKKINTNGTLHLIYSVKKY